MSMRWVRPSKANSNPPCRKPSRSRREPTPACRSRSTVPCSRTPARMRASTYSRVRLSSTTDRTPERSKSRASISPEGPAPTIATCVLVMLAWSGKNPLHGMDGARQNLYFSDMAAPSKATHRAASASPVPAFFLYGEAPQAPDEATVHIETIAARSRLHDWRIRPHRHRDLHQILLVQKGAVTARLDRETCALRGPCVVIAPPGAVHGFEFEADTVGWVCSFSIGLAQDLSARSAGFRRFLEQPAAAALSTATVLATDLVELSEMLLREFERS